MYQAQLNKSMVNLLEMNYNFNSSVANVVNTLEARIRPTALVTTHVAYSNASDRQNSVGLDVEKELGALTVKAGISHKFEKNMIDSRTAIKGGVAYELNKQVKVSVAVERELIDPAGDNNRVTKAKMGLKVEL
jgi:hypothetical protein